MEAFGLRRRCDSWTLISAKLIHRPNKFYLQSKKILSTEQNSSTDQKIFIHRANLIHRGFLSTENSYPQRILIHAEFLSTEDSYPQGEMKVDLPEIAAASGNLVKKDLLAFF